MYKKIRVLVLAAIIAAICVGIVEKFAVPGVHGFVSSAEAIVGRPLTPVSVAGVARRTAGYCEQSQAATVSACECFGFC
jgi:hypothetical protein